MLLSGTTQKNSFLDFLIQVAQMPGELVLEVESLPVFLDTPLAVNIFLNQTRGYPRTIVWKTNNEQIFQVLATSKLPLELIDYTPPSGKRKIEIKKTLEETLLATTRRSAEPTLITTFAKFDIARMFKPRITTNPVSTKVTSIKTTQPSVQAKPVISQHHSPNLENLPTEQEKRISIFRSPLPQNNSTYQPLLVVRDGEILSPTSTNTESITTPQDGLDNWLTNIEKAKESIEKSKKNSSFFTGHDPASQLRDAFVNHNKKKQKRSNTQPAFALVGRIALATVSALVIAGIWFGFGGVFSSPDVYTIRVRQERKEESLSLVIPFSKAEFLVSEERFESTLTTTGKGSDDTNAKGKISLINESSQGIALNNAGFYLQKGSITYTVTANDSLPSVISIPGGTKGEEFSFSVRANISGTAAALTKGERLTLRNLAGALVSDKLYARVTTDITLPKVGKFVEKQDLDALTKTNNDKNQAKVTEKLNSLSSDKISSPTLVKTDVLKESANAAVNDTADTVTKITDFKNTLTYFSRQVLIDGIQEKMNTNRVESLRVTGIEKQETAYTVALSTVFYLGSEVDTSEAKKLLQTNQNLQDTTITLKNKFPSIQSIDQKKGYGLFQQEPKVTVQTE